MNIVTEAFSRIVAKYATNHKDKLLTKRKVIEFLNKHDEHYLRWSAYGALKGTPIDVGTDPNRNDYPNYDKIPTGQLNSLKQGTFSSYDARGTTRKQREAIQHIFTHGDDPRTVNADRNFRAGYLQGLDWGFHESAEEYLKVRWATTALILAIIIVGLGSVGMLT